MVVALLAITFWYGVKTFDECEGLVDDGFFRKGRNELYPCFWQRLPF